MLRTRTLSAAIALALAPALGAAGCGDSDTSSGGKPDPYAAKAAPADTTATETTAGADQDGAPAASEADLPDFSGTLADGSAFDQTMVPANTVIHVFASWCPTCKADAPDFAKFQQENPDLNYLYIAVEDDPADSKAFMAEYGFADGKVINDADRSVEEAFGLTGQPNTVFVPAEGELTKIIGPADVERLNQAAEQLSS